MESFYDDFFNKLANKTRLKILYCLKNKSMSVSEIVECTGLEQSLVSHNLRLLRDCCFVDFKIKGKQRIYSLNKKTIRPLFRLVDKHNAEFCDCKCSFGDCNKVGKK